MVEWGKWEFKPVFCNAASDGNNEYYKTRSYKHWRELSMLMSSPLLTSNIIKAVSWSSKKNGGECETSHILQTPQLMEACICSSKLQIKIMTKLRGIFNLCFCCLCHHQWRWSSESVSKWESVCKRSRLLQIVADQKKKIIINLE